MAFEIKIGDRLAKVDLLNRSGNKAIIRIDDEKFEVDIVEVENGIYSILYNHKSYNVELVGDESAKKYVVNTFRFSYEVEIIDSETKYQKIRNKSIEEESGKMISTPMPGKVIKILVKAGDEVSAGQTVLVVEAMKMQNEYQVKKDSKIKEVLVNEGDTITSHQPLIILE